MHVRGPSGASASGGGTWVHLLFQRVLVYLSGLGRK